MDSGKTNNLLNPNCIFAFGIAASCIILALKLKSEQAKEVFIAYASVVKEMAISSRNCIS